MSRNSNEKTFNRDHLFVKPQPPSIHIHESTKLEKFGNILLWIFCLFCGLLIAIFPPLGFLVAGLGILIIPILFK
ncbi:hypothetical protein [Prochlorococcus sp. MIT 0604]|uniref:hypothetical protein n=1 Tax=Prochlorococcus sp. MIT 0604 TaxID=1501268 RepID=UPI0004F81F32|nr:hypothetical protein [Prochlorococcus sp. MIT 0604]AIQ94084.1 hypothetical protein EW14_0056 [Prochlorococcus sp. MIT 0604]